MHDVHRFVYLSGDVALAQDICRFAAPGPFATASAASRATC
jgi:hypothetical protein